MKRHNNHVKNSACIISSYHWQACSILWPNKTSSHRRFSPAGPGWSVVCWWCEQWCGGTPRGVVWPAGFGLCGLHEGPGDQWTGIWPCLLCQETRLRWERFCKAQNSQKHYAVKCYICTSQTCWFLKDLLILICVFPTTHSFLLFHRLNRQLLPQRWRLLLLQPLHAWRFLSWGLGTLYLWLLPHLLCGANLW